MFAEVDDQRQAMKKLLNAQKKSYLEMKKIYSESEYEIRRLKRENTSMRTELEACSSIFCYADRTYQGKKTHFIARHIFIFQMKNFSRKTKPTYSTATK